MQISAKVATQFATTVLTFLAGYLIVRLGLQGNAEVSALLPGLVASGAGIFAGWWVKEENLPPKPVTPKPAPVSLQVGTSEEKVPERLQVQHDAEAPIRSNNPPF